MRQAVIKELHYVGLLLQADKRQKKALVKTVTNNQMKALVEIVYNILHGYGSLSADDKSYLRKYQSIIRRFVHKRFASAPRRQLLQRHIQIFSRLLKSIEKNIVIEWRKN